MRLPFAVVISVSFSFLVGCGSGSSSSSSPNSSTPVQGGSTQTIKNIDASVAPAPVGSAARDLQWVASEELQNHLRVDTLMLPPLMTGFNDVHSELEANGFHLQGTYFKYYFSELQIFADSDLSTPVAVAELNMGAIPNALEMETNEVLVFASNEEYVDIGSEQPVDMSVSSKIIPEGMITRPITELTWINVEDFYNPSVSQELAFYGEVLGTARGESHWLVVSGLTDQPAAEVDGCYVLGGDENAGWGQVFSVSLIDANAKTLTHTVCIRADLEQVVLSGSSISLRDMGGVAHEFLWSSMGVDYLGSQ